MLEVHAWLRFSACMHKKAKIQHTVRDIPKEVDTRLREMAAAEDISLNQAALRAMQRGLGEGTKPVRYRALRHLIQRDDKVDRKGWEVVLESMDRVNPEDWK